MECGICTENFDATDRVPKVLPCGHTVCLKCLLRLPDRRCPTCRRDFNGPPPEVPTNFAVLQSLEGVRQETRHVEDTKKIMRLVLAAALIKRLTEDRAAAARGAAGALPQREVDVAAISSGPYAQQQEKAAALRDAPGVTRLVGVVCCWDTAWSLKLLQLAGPTLEQLSVKYLHEEHLLAVHAMPRLRRLEMSGDKVPPSFMLPELPPSHAGLQWLRVQGLPRATTHSLLQTHARSLQSLQLFVGFPEPWEDCPDLPALLEQCGLRALRRLVLRGGCGFVRTCDKRRAEVCKVLPGREVVWSGCLSCPSGTVIEEAF